MKQFWKCVQDSGCHDKDWGFEAVRVDRPAGIPAKHVELCYAEISHFLVLVSDVISIHVKFDEFKNFDPVADPGSLNFWTLLRRSSIRLSCFLSFTTCDLLEDRADQISDKNELLRSCFDASNSSCDRAPIGPPTPHTCSGAISDIFGANWPDRDRCLVWSELSFWM
jgi:hypothetical protein